MNENFIDNSINFNKPNVLNYINPNKYLQDYYNYRKQLDSQFSYEIWAQELNLKSRSFVRMVCYGQKVITDNFALLFSQNAKLSATEIDYLILLARHQNTKSKSLKQAYFSKIAENTTALGNPKEIKDRLLFLSQSILPTLHLLISFKDFKATEENIMQSLKIRKSDLNRHLKQLSDLEMIESQIIEETNEKVWISNFKYFKVSDQVNNEAIKNYQKENLSESLKSIDEIDEELTRFRTVLFSLATSDFNELKNDIEDFFAKIKFKYANDHIQNKKLYKVNLQTYPVTE